MHTKDIKSAGKTLEAAKKALIMIHGRGGSADDILSLAEHFNVADFALMAPQASHHTWYPNSFLAPLEENEPWLSAALNILKELVAEIKSAGVSPENIYFLGFSQGACLSLEFVARNAQKFGGVAAFTGGLIGDKIYKENYSGDFKETPVFIGSGDPDAHVPVQRVHDTTSLLKEMNAAVTEKIYPGMPHTINQDEIDTANKLIFQ